MSDRENITDQENIDEFQIEEVSTYPINNNILYRERVNKVTKRSFNYVIIKKGVYPNGTQTGPKSLQDSVICKTTWGRASKKKTIRCEIDYINEIPQFRIKYGSNFQYVVFSSKSPSDAAYNYERALKPETKATLSGPLVFGLQLKSVKKARESRKRGNLIKPAINCTSSTLEKRAKKIASKVRANYEEDENQMEKDYQLQSIVKAIDQGQIPRDSYRDLAATEHHLPRENTVSNERIAITKHMNKIIKFSLVNMKDKNELNNITSQEPDIMNPEIVQEVINTMGLGIRHPIIHLRVSGDGRNVGRKIKHVMVIFMILNHKNRHHHADYHYTVALYPCTEKYDTLKFMLSLFINELKSFKENGLEVSGILWKFELYFSSDWKFLAICLGLNGLTANYFCPWCCCSKNQIGDLNRNWCIEKSIDQLITNYNEINGHINPPFFSIIPIENIIFDELHALLRITDRLWELMLAEIQENDEKSYVWKYTSLMGDDKKTVLQFFNLKLLFKPSRVELIRKLWDGFYELYCALRNKNTDPAQLKQQSLEWLSLFLTPLQGNPSHPKTYVRGLYMLNQITPYMHALVYHG
ncbi:hypothetical protein GLOIN_2v1780831 [Rhizophagus irregularis DAOM 181602=DAOM 197198]|uniref:Uncharacterized protein n=1 Tax=Rhizophagus irregularis (strain DAOM 181602 / DAOM 197198 / MUCL 43194) TaxID=747089 RepID=A0A2P4PLA9_RHIID|nr:hypothetical protein GLOIN_2v1780831 [Rhizophagus irregularis DAOM 181602=DAOM 197198]POG66169.1 hypothetical protein GLOIN_2v1780831 [Rhizophagus irregularis DAOM 181602=DAOM 197198]|eukprot:XP_025173035.1 hypothetical protein GLOIN_2v1780831 [Rhizophagus irregularis DAOM 181602=DAOM 197198]